MKIDDIKVGTDYARRYGGRVRVLAIETVQEPMWSYRQGSSHRNVRKLRVMPLFEDGRTHPDQKPLLLKAADLKTPWEEHAARIQARDERDAASRAAADRVFSALKTVGIQPNVHARWNSSSVDITLTPAEADALVAVLTPDDGNEEQ